MGTRADFYVGRGVAAEWLGSVAYDGYPGSVGLEVLMATDEAGFRAAVESFFAKRDDTTRSADGWPWQPECCSRHADYTYAFVDSEVLISEFGRSYQTFQEFKNPTKDYWDRPHEVFPDMRARSNTKV